jgi:hypothetical protein
MLDSGESEPGFAALVRDLERLSWQLWTHRSAHTTCAESRSLKFRRCDQLFTYGSVRIASPIPSGYDCVRRSLSQAGHMNPSALATT